MKISARQYWNLLIDYLKPQWPRVLLLAVLLFSNIGLQLINPQILRYFIDTVSGNLTSGRGIVDKISRYFIDATGLGFEKLTVAAMLFIGVALVQQFASVFATYISQNVGWTATNALRRDLASHCLRLDMSFHNARTPGEMIERIDGDVNSLGNFFSQFIVQVLGNAMLLVGVLLLLFREDWQVGLPLSGFTLVALLVLNSLRDIATPHWAASRQASADTFGFLEERLSGTEDIRSSGAKAYVLRRFYQLMRTWLQKELKAGWMVNIMMNTTFVLFAVGNAVGLGFGAYLFQKNLITIGTVYLIFHYTNMLMNPIERIMRQMEDLQKASASIGRLQELTHIKSKLKDGLGCHLPPSALSVEFQGVSFGYVKEEMVLQNLSFRLQPGQVLGLLGRTGSGKTTITRLLFRLYDATTGVVRLGDVDIRAERMVDLRQRIGMVTQDVQLFHASVRDNLTFFDKRIPDDRILHVIRELGLSAWYESLPEGLDTTLAAGGGGLSAGEAQLLALTRVFLEDPGLVILDEASSRLDPATEQLIEKALDRLLDNRTGIIIAHRLATVQRADEIMILEDGHIREYGKRIQLASDPTSHFYHLLQTGFEEVLA